MIHLHPFLFAGIQHGKAAPFRQYRLRYMPFYNTICMEQPYNRTLLILKESFQGFSASGERLIINGFTS